MEKKWFIGFPVDEFCPVEEEVSSDDGKPSFFRVQSRDESNFPPRVFSAVKIGSVEAAAGGDSLIETEALSEAIIDVRWTIETGFTDKR